MESLVALLAANPTYGWVVGVISVLYVCAAELVTHTPTKADDAFITKLQNIPILGVFLQALGKFKSKPPQS